jgi:hypothetical protein
MYRAFNLTGCNWEKVSGGTGDAIFKNNSDIVRKSLEPFLNGEIVDGTKLANFWFPAIEANVFISHSHRDAEHAIKLAGWLKENLGLDCFIDSCVWGHAADLLKIIDIDQCKIPNSENFDYDKRNGSTSHVHMMFSNALNVMIDSTECVIFIKTDNSITSTKSIEKTQSPWLFFELGTMRIIRRKKPSRKVVRRENFSRDIVKASEFLRVEYEVPLSELTPLSGTQLDDWNQAYRARPDAGKHSLDFLYDIVTTVET